jgi:hypothetical protein
MTDRTKIRIAGTVTALFLACLAIAGLTLRSDGSGQGVVPASAPASPAAEQSIAAQPASTGVVELPEAVSADLEADDDYDDEDLDELEEGEEYD